MNGSGNSSVGTLHDDEVAVIQRLRAPAHEHLPDGLRVGQLDAAEGVEAEAVDLPGLHDGILSRGYGRGSRQRSKNGSASLQVLAAEDHDFCNA